MFKAWLSVTVILAAPAAAQWINHRDPRIPRTPDGKPNLTAPAPKAADGMLDLSGIWQASTGKYLENLAADNSGLQLLPWADKIYKERQENNGKGRPSERCVGHGLTDADALPVPFRIVQNPGVTFVLFEAYNHWRQIFTDGREYPPDLNPSWFGSSVGKWDGNTFVVDTIGFHDRSWLDDGGHPHTESLHVTERFQRRDFGHMQIQLTIDDPKTYAKPWRATIPYQLLADTEIIESICENEKDLPHMVGK
jgi:hypothetical protein